MSIKFNIYFSSSPNGPWTLANQTPIDRIPAGNEHTILGLKTNTQYYVAVVPGTLNENDEFVALLAQAIGEEGISAGGIESVRLPVFSTRTFAPKIIVTGTPMGHRFNVDTALTSSLGMQFTVNAINVTKGLSHKFTIV